MAKRCDFLSQLRIHVHAHGKCAVAKETKYFISSYLVLSEVGKNFNAFTKIMLLKGYLSS